MNNKMEEITSIAVFISFVNFKIVLVFSKFKIKNI